MSSSTLDQPRARNFLVLTATLLLFWILLSGSLSADVLLVGIVVAALISFVFSSGLSFFTELRLTPAAMRAGFSYYGYFFRALMRSNLQMAAIILSPSLPISPAIVKVRTRLQSRMGRLMLANSITLTPGTLTVDIEGEWLYVHCVSQSDVDVEAATQQIAAGFERYLEVMYG
jgi:multicomponent Na+:H+ antiporter subunit E